MPLPERNQVPLRLPLALIVRLDKAATHKGKTRQDFQQDAIVAAVEQAEAEMALSSQDRRQRRREERASNRGAEPAGLDLDFVRQAPKTTKAPPAEPTGQVVVNNYASTGGSGDDIISVFADYIVAGTEHDRDRRTQMAVDVLRASAKSDDKRNELAKKLDAAVEARLKDSRREQGSLIQMAADTFHKIKDWIPQ